MPESGEDFDIVDQYDSVEAPWLRSEFLDAIGTTRPHIDALRRGRDAERKATKATPPQDEPATPARAGEARPSHPPHAPPHPGSRDPPAEQGAGATQVPAPASSGTSRRHP
ncbi:hypothetical protein ACGFN1_00765 [Streptomyces sp. NPDC048685]|uniref:hypothetical protein n=1 Tax=Streptomyces sp. NPDC048685 TaxID=3365584 RepID=UPI00371684A6